MTWTETAIIVATMGIAIGAARGESCRAPDVARVVELPFTPAETIDTVFHAPKLVLSCPPEGVCHWVAEPEPLRVPRTIVRCLTPEAERDAIERGQSR